MKHQILIAVFAWSTLSHVALAHDPSTLRAGDLICLKKALHGATQSQLEQRYQAYSEQMNAYLTDLPSIANIWMNVNEIKRKKLQTPAILNPTMMESQADKSMAQHIETVNAARQNLLKITSANALRQVDKNHQWELPASLSQIKPPAGVTDPKALSPMLLRAVSR